MTRPYLRSNPGHAFVAQFLRQRTAQPQPCCSLVRDPVTYWNHVASDLLIAMYAAGFTIPRPTDEDAVWALIREKSDA